MCIAVLSIGLVCMVGVGLVVRRWLFHLVHGAPCDVDWGCTVAVYRASDE